MFQDWPGLLNALGALIIGLGGKELISGWIRKRNGKADEEKGRAKEAIEQVEHYRAKLER